MTSSKFPLTLWNEIFFLFFGEKGLAKICPHQIFAAKASAVLTRQTPKTPRALVLLRRLRGVDEPGAVRPNIYASKRLARTQEHLLLKAILRQFCYSVLSRCADEPRDALLAIPPTSRTGENALSAQPPALLWG